MGAVNVIVLLFISRHEDWNVLLDGKVIRNVFTEERHTKIQTWTRVDVPCRVQLSFRNQMFQFLPRL